MQTKAKRAFEDRHESTRAYKRVGKFVKSLADAVKSI